MKVILRDRYFILIAFLSVAVVLLAAIAPDRPEPYNVTSYGAVGDGLTMNTAAIQKTIDTCAAAGGGLVVIPKGVFVSGAIFLKKNVDLEIEKDGVLKGSVQPADYPQIDTRWEGTEKKFTAALLNADHLTNLKIFGEGTIDGSGEVWAQRLREKKDTSAAITRVGRPRLICIQNCNSIAIADLKLHNQAVWCLHILYSENVLVNGLHISADHNIPSSDGIDIDSSKKITVQNCDIDVNDDCISIKSGKDEDGLRVNRPSEDIVIRKCRFGYGHGGVAMGSETSGGIRNVLVKDCKADAGNWAPIRFKSQPSRGGVVENITYKNFTLRDTRKAVEFTMAWRMIGVVKPPARVLPVVKNIHIINVTGTVETVGDIHGLTDSPIQDVTFKNCKIQAKRGLFIEHARNVDLNGLRMSVKEGDAIQKEDVE